MEIPPIRLTPDYIEAQDTATIVDIMARLLNGFREHHLFTQQMSYCLSALKEKLHEERSIPPVIEDHYSDSLNADVTGYFPA